jgi:hypothetical protein
MKAFITGFNCFAPRFPNLRTFHVRIYSLRVQAFGLKSQYLVSTVSQAQKITLRMPTRRISEHLSWLGDEAAPLPSTQALPDIAKGQDIEAFTKIEEVELHDAVNVIGTSTGAEGHTLSHRSRRQRLVKNR